MEEYGSKFARFECGINSNCMTFGIDEEYYHDNITYINTIRFF